MEAIDASALQILYELTKSYIENGVGVHFAHLRPAHVDAFKLVGIADMVSGPSFDPHACLTPCSAARRISIVTCGTR